MQLNGIALSAGDEVTVNQLDSEQLIYSPGADRFGADDASFEFRVIDDNSQPAISQESNRLTVSIDPVSDAPSGKSITITTAEDTDYVFSRSDFGFSDTADGHTLSFITITSLPAIGTLSHQGVDVNAGDIVNHESLDAGDLVYRPPLNVSGPVFDSDTPVQNNIGFTVTDNGVIDPGAIDPGGIDLGGENTSNVESITIDLAQVNDPPMLVLNGATVLEGGTVLIDSAALGGVDPDDTDPEELALTVTTLPLHGQLLLNGEVITAGTSLTLESIETCLLYTSPSPRDGLLSRMPSSA